MNGKCSKIDKNRSLLNHHLTRIKSGDAKAFEGLARRLKIILEDPSLNRAKIEIVTRSFDLWILLVVNGYVMTRQGPPVALDTYRNTLERLMKSGELKGHLPILDAQTLIRNSTYSFSVSPGDIKVYGLRTWFEPAYGLSDDRWYNKISNTMSFNLPAQGTVRLELQKTPTEGFFGNKKLIDADFYLKELEVR